MSMNSYPRLDSKQSEAFLAVLDGGSFERAAETLHITISAVSQRIKALETQLGTTLLLRTRPCKTNSAGQKLLQHLRRVAELEQDLRSEFHGAQANAVSLALAVNADSLDSWVLPAIAGFLQDEHIQVEWIIDDQDHTYDLLENGAVLGCISAEPKAMRGCASEPLGIMRYHAVASRRYFQQWFPQGVQRDSLRAAPVLCFNRKDKLPSVFLLTHFGLQEDACPRHFIPATSTYNRAVLRGLGWGMIPEMMLDALPEKAELIRLASEHPVDVPLYWHHWKVQTPRLARLTRQLLAQAKLLLLQGDA